MAGSNRKNGARSVGIEWIAGGLGLLLTLGLLGFLGWQAVTVDRQVPPQLDLRVESVAPAGAGYVAAIVVRNRSPHTAGGVEVEGTLAGETSSVTFSYVPGGSSVRGGLYFSSDPSAGGLRLRALGYSDP